MASLQFTEGPSIPEPYMKRKQLLNHILDGLAQARPFSVWAEIPNSATNYGAGFRRVTYRDLSNTINGVAWWLYNALSKGTGFKTLAYIGLWDVRYVILLLGAVKAGYIVSHVIKKLSWPLTSFKPLELKQQISGHPEIKAALMDGTRRPQAALLIELGDPRGPSEDGHSGDNGALVANHSRSKRNVHGSVCHSEVTHCFHASRDPFADGRQRNGVTSTSFLDVMRPG